MQNASKHQSDVKQHLHQLPIHAYLLIVPFIVFDEACLYKL